MTVHERDAERSEGADGQTCLSRDGVAVQIRNAGRSDAPTIELMLQRLSPRSVYQRFLAASPRSAHPYVERLFDPARTLDAVVGVIEGEVVGVGSTHQLSDTSAEFALAVADAHQGRGLGTLLLEALVQRAGARGQLALVGEVLVGNGQMLDVLRHLGLPVKIRMERGVTEVIVPLGDLRGYPEATARRAATARGVHRPLLDPSETPAGPLA